MNKFDTIIIGAGMSGLAAAIRLAMYDKKVCVVERHSIAGGLNSYYQRKNSKYGGIYKLDVGLHALTNYMKKGDKKKPFSKLLKQLRLNYDDFKLCPQNYSKIQFGDTSLKFSNDFELLKNEIQTTFPAEMDNFIKLVEKINAFDELNLNHSYSSAKQIVGTIIKDELLLNMIFCPLLIYGSAWEDDMDFSQFVIMFKSLYYEGFSRPEGGVRTIIEILLNKLRDLGVEIKFRHQVESIIIRDNKAVGIKTDKGEFLADNILSSMGYPETMQVCDTKAKPSPSVGPMSFMETLIITDKKIPLKDNDSTIVFYNDSDIYNYKKAKDYFDDSSAVVCFPDNYELDKREGEGIVRVTYIANYEKFKNLDRELYLEKKEEVFNSSIKLIKKLIPNFNEEINFKDVFSPLTVKRYTGHFDGTVYGSTDKTRDGQTPIKNLFIMGTDQGFLGIIGSMLSGISMANLYGLMNAQEIRE